MTISQFRIHFFILLPKLFIALFLLSACDAQQEKSEKIGNEFQCDHDNGGLVLPEGFCAKVVADNLGIVRHIAVRNAGQIYASLRNRSLNIGGILVLSDTDNDHYLEEVTRISEAPGMGIGLYQDYLYFASDTDVIRYPLSPNEAMPLPTVETVISGLPKQQQHSGKPFTFDETGNMYINIGSNSNACQVNDRKIREISPDPCHELEQLAGIWKFDANQLDQVFSERNRYASGIRNAYAIDWHKEFGKLYIAQHGRDHLHELWPEHFSLMDEERLPAEELIEVKSDGVYAWPYCYFDQFKDEYVLAPEYLGDGETIGQCGRFPKPLIAFPGHYGPNDLVVYDGKQFPEPYQNGVFIAFHGSYLKSATEQVGYQVVFVPKAGESLSSEWTVFADGFIGAKAISSPQDAEYRPTGLALGEDGSLYISDSVQGRIWRVVYQHLQ